MKYSRVRIQLTRELTRGELYPEVLMDVDTPALAAAQCSAQDVDAVGEDEEEDAEKDPELPAKRKCIAPASPLVSYSPFRCSAVVTDLFPFQPICDFCRSHGYNCNSPTDGSACNPCRQGHKGCSLSDSKCSCRGMLFLFLYNPESS